MKIVVDQRDRQSLGLPHGRPGCRRNHPGLAVAMNCGGTKAQFDATIGIHPRRRKSS